MGQRVFYVAQNGSDKAQGTKAAPFGTINRAMEEVRKYNKEMDGDIYVYVSGRFVLTEPIVFYEQDSGYNGFKVIYKSEDAVLDGGLRLTGWTEEAKGIWKASAHGLRVRQIYINGKRAHNAEAAGEFAKDWVLTENGYTVPAGILSDMKNPEDMELMYHHPGWTEGRIGIEKIDGNSVIMKQPAFRMGRRFAYMLPTRLGNAYEFIAEDGDWCVDTAEDTVYLKYSGNPNDSEIIAGNIEQLMVFDGTYEKCVHDIVIDGFRFEYASWYRPDSDLGFVAVQASLSYEENDVGGLDMIKTFGTVDAKNAYGLEFVNNTFCHLGGSALDLDIGCREILVQGNNFYDLSNNAIMVGNMMAVDAHPNRDDMRRRVYNIRILNNHMTDNGADYPGAVTLLVGHATDIEIAYNEIHHVPYTGISLGWGWGGHDTDPNDPTIDGGHYVHHNHIHNIMQKMYDGGAVYTLGSQPGTRVEYNVFHDQYHDYGTMYWDDGSRGISMTHNCVYDSLRNVIMKGAKNVSRDNYFERVDNMMFGLYDDTNILEPNTHVTDMNFPLELLNGAGLRPEFYHLQPKYSYADLAFGRKTRLFDGNKWRDNKADEGKSANAVNHDTTTAVTPLNSGSGIMVDLQYVYNVSEIVVTTAATGGKYAVESTVDGIEWEKIAEISNDSTITPISAGPRYMRDIRITVLEGTVQFAEVEAYEGKAPVRDGGYSDVCLSIVSSLSNRVYIGETACAVAKGIYSDGLKERYRGGVEFVSTDPSVINVDAQGNLTAKKAGTAQIKAKFGGTTIAVDIESYEDIFEKVEISLDKPYYHIGDTAKISITGAYRVSGRPIEISKLKVAFRAEEPEIASVDKYEIKALANGNSLIFADAEFEGKKVTGETVMPVFPDKWDAMHIGVGKSRIKYDGDKWRIDGRGENIYAAGDDFGYLYTDIDLNEYPSGVSIEMFIEDCYHVGGRMPLMMCGPMIRKAVTRESMLAMYRMQVQRFVDEDKYNPWMAPFVVRTGDFLNCFYKNTPEVCLGAGLRLTYADKKVIAYVWDKDNNEWKQVAEQENIDFGERFTVGMAFTSGSIDIDAYALGSGLAVKPL